MIIFLLILYLAIKYPTLIVPILVLSYLVMAWLLYFKPNRLVAFAHRMHAAQDKAEKNARRALATQRRYRASLNQGD